MIGRTDPRAQVALLGVGLVWSIGVVLWKLVANSGFSPLGLTLWQTMLAIVLLAPLVRLRGKRLPLQRAYLGFYIGLGLLGSLVPTLAYYIALRGLDAGVAAIVLSCVPMMALVAAGILGIDRPTLPRIMGVAFGFIAVLLIAAPGSLPDEGTWIYLGFALITTICYALEGCWITLRRPSGLDPMVALLGASLTMLVISLPLTILTGHFVTPFQPWGDAGWAMLLATLSNVSAYLGYIWIVGRSGPVFAAQVSYIITLAGVFWSLTLLGERYSGPVWIALVLMIAGLALVQPRRPDPPTAKAGEA